MLAHVVSLGARGYLPTGEPWPQVQSETVGSSLAMAASVDRKVRPGEPNRGLGSSPGWQMQPSHLEGVWPTSSAESVALAMP